MKKAFIIIIILLLPIILASQDLKYWFPEEFEVNIIPEKRIALVIGNTDYNDDLLDLKNPVNDANLISSTLTKLDFDVILRENLNKKTRFILNNMESAYANKVKMLKKLIRKDK